MQADKLKVFLTLNQHVTNCCLCPRLVHFRETVPERRSFKEQTYWRRPVPGFGDPEAWLLIVGLAPAIHGGNRTGRIFTGDDSARFLMKNLYVEGFANQPISESREDGLQFRGCYMTAAVKCVPPKHKPTRQEFHTCSQYLLREFQLLTKLKAVLALGRMAFEAYLQLLKQLGVSFGHLKFAHGENYLITNSPRIYTSYHPSPQNTFTGKLTDQMFLEVLRNIKKDCALA